MSHHEVFVNKTTLINILGPSAMKFAVFISGDSVEGKAMKVLFENIDLLDLNCELVQEQILPTMVAVGVFDQSDIDRINSYVSNCLS